MSLYNLTLKVIVSPTRIQDMLTQIGGHGYETLESFFSTLTGLAIESMGSSTGIERKEMYNHVSSRNKCHIYQVQFESECKEPFEAVFFNEYIIKMLEAASPYVAHNTIGIYNGRKPLVSHMIRIGGTDFEVVRPELKRTASCHPPITPPAPKKVKVMESASEPAPFHENLMDSMPSKFVLKLIIPDANQDQALSVVQGLKFSSIETFFDALYMMIPLMNKTLDYNQVSRGNGAHIFNASFEALADNYVYGFSKNAIEMIKAISPCCADDYLSLSAPVKQPNGIITYEPFNHYYIAVGRKSRFQYYMGEDGEEEEVSVIEVVKEDEDADVDFDFDFTPNEVMNETVFSESFLDDKKGNDGLLLHVKAENQRIYHKIHARYEELLLKLEDLVFERDGCNAEIEITRRLIKELQELV